VIALAFTLNILGNLMRIIMLVVMNISPGNAMHDGVGLICLLVYVAVPLFFAVRLIHQRFAGPVNPPTSLLQIRPAYLLPMHPLILVSCAFFCFQKPQSNIRSVAATTVSTPQDYEVNQLASGVMQCKNRDALVYIKPIPAFYSTDHSPATCWTGSGYHLGRISEKRIGGNTVYIGVLKNGSGELQTAWWFSDGHSTAISQLDWRWKSIVHNRRFQLINVTANNAKELDKEVKRWLPAICGYIAIIHVFSRKRPDNQ
jgi:exosortase N